MPTQPRVTVPGFDDLLHHLPREARRNRETYALRAAGARVDRRVDADQIAVHVHQRAPRIAGIDRRIGLNKILECVDAQMAAAERADDAGSDGLADAERIADRKHDVADARLLGLREGHRRQVLQIELEHGKIRIRIAADHLRLGAARILRARLRSRRPLRLRGGWSGCNPCR
jgi:hypothetical protein